MRPFATKSPRGDPARAFLLAAACLAGCGGAHAISLEGSRFRVRGGDPGGGFAVYVADARDPLFGEVRVEGGDLLFEPRFPLREGMAYRAVYRPAGGPAVERTFALPAPPPAPPTFVRAVFPSRATLPENQLKFYLHFSGPMARGEAYRRIHLVESGGREVDFPFLELGEELWDPEGKRLTLFFDPGRIKRGLKPREEAGPSLEEGKSYTLVIDREWSDAAGRPLRESHRKSFKAGSPDDTQPDPKRWALHLPRAGTRDPLEVVFDEPMDEGMLGRVLVVLDDGGRRVAGRVEVGREETRWRFRPDAAWRAGKFALAVDTDLEDLAGNSIARPFEVDVFRPVERAILTKTVSLPFEVRE